MWLHDFLRQVGGCRIGFQKPRSLSLRLRIMAAVAIGLTTVMAFLGIWGLQVLHESRRRLLSERLITARALAERLDDALLVAVAHLVGLGAFDELRQLATPPDGAERWDTLGARVPFASYGLYLVDDRGSVINASRPLLQDLGRDLSSYAAVRRVLAGTRVAISDLLEAPGTRTPIMLVCVAKDPGALCAASDLSQNPFDHYISGLQLGRTGHAVIVDAQGRVLASTDPDDRFGNDEHPDFHTDLITRREARVGRAAYYQRGVPIEQHVMAFAPSRVASWGVSYGQTEAETLAPVAQARARMLGFGLLALLAAITFAWWDTGTVTRPLRHLADQTQRIASGDLTGSVAIPRKDELGALAGSFEIMRARLRTLLEDLTRRETEAQALYAVSREVLSRPDLRGILQSIADHARRLLDADVAIICLSGERWHGEPAAVSGPDDAVVPGAPPLLLCAERNGPALRIPADGCPLVDTAYGRAHAVAALTLDGVAQGALCVGARRAGQFDPRASSLLSGLANLAAIALRSTELHEQLHHLAVLEERERIGRDLHDSTLQALYGIALTLESARATVASDPAATTARTEQSLAAISKVSGEIRGFVQGLSTPGAADRSVVEELASLVEGMNSSGAVRVSLVVHDDGADLPSTDRAQMVLVVREALANVMRHSRASRAEVRLEASPETIRVTVQDNGCGFDPDAAQGQGEGLGNMAARAARIGGRLTITSSPETGTAVDIALPRQDRGGGLRGRPSRASARR